VTLLYHPLFAQMYTNITSIARCGFTRIMSRDNFRPITTPVPEFLPMTSEEQETYGRAMNIPQRLWGNILKRPVLCAPQTPRCIRWSEWAMRNNGLPPGAGFMLMSTEQYNVRAASSANPHNSDHQEFSVQAFGKPLVLYGWVIGAIDEQTEQDG
jgi:hypothetical protein